MGRFEVEIDLADVPGAELASFQAANSIVSRSLALVFDAMLVWMEELLGPLEAPDSARPPTPPSRSSCPSSYTGTTTGALFAFIHSLCSTLCRRMLSFRIRE